jgi:hypothetical protein
MSRQWLPSCEAVFALLWSRALSNEDMCQPTKHLTLHVLVSAPQARWPRKLGGCVKVRRTRSGCRIARTRRMRGRSTCVESMGVQRVHPPAHFGPSR